MPPPLISVIVVCRNPGPRLHAALESVWSQSGAEAEVVVVDGASQDGTPAWLQSQSARLGAWISEPDDGVYDAMNKGTRLARGSWLLFLGADDVLAAPDTLARVTPILHSTHAAVVAGAARYDDGRHYAPASDAQAIRRNFLHHQAAFYRRSTLSPSGGYDATLSYQADYDLNLRLLRTGGGVHRIDTLISLCARGGLSDAGHWANYREEIVVRHRHFPSWQCLPWDATAIARWMRKRVFTHGLRPKHASAG